MSATVQDIIAQATAKAQAGDATKVQQAFRSLATSLGTDVLPNLWAQPSGLFDAQQKPLTIQQALVTVAQSIIAARAPTVGQVLLDQIASQLQK